MRRELENYESVELTNRYERLRAPQPWSNTRRMAPIVIGTIVAWILMGFVFWWLSKGKH